MFLLVPAHPGFPGQIPQSRKTVVCVYCYVVWCILHAFVADLSISHSCLIILLAHA